MTETAPSLHISTIIEKPEREVYAFAGDARNLPRWARGLGGGEMTQQLDGWSMDSPMGRLLVTFVPENLFGVLDHTVTLENGESTVNPMRVLSLDAGRSEVVFTLRRGSMSEAELEEDAASVAEDLAALKSLLES